MPIPYDGLVIVKVWVSPVVRGEYRLVGGDEAVVGDDQAGGEGDVVEVELARDLREHRREIGVELERECCLGIARRGGDEEREGVESCSGEVDVAGAAGSLTGELEVALAGVERDREGVAGAAEGDVEGELEVRGVRRDVHPVVGDRVGGECRAHLEAMRRVDGLDPPGALRAHERRAAGPALERPAGDLIPREQPVADVKVTHLEVAVDRRSRRRRLDEHVGRSQGVGDVAVDQGIRTHRRAGRGGDTSGGARRRRQGPSRTSPRRSLPRGRRRAA